NREAPFERPLLAAADTLGPLESRSYDGTGRLTAITNGAGETTAYGYGENELVETIAGPEGVVRTCLEHGEHGHPLRLRLGEIEELRVFDAVGNLLRGTREFEPLPGGVLSRTWDEDRNLVGLELADLDFSGVATRSERVTLKTGSDGRLLRIQRPGGADHEIDYDALGRPVERRERVNGIWWGTRFEYDPSGRIVASELPNGMRQELEYDAAGRVSTRRALRAGVLESRVDFAYSEGRLTSVDDSLRGGTEDFFYDSAGRLVQIDFPDGERLVLGHDARGRRVSEDYWMPGAVLLRSLSFSFDAADRELGVSDGGLPVIARSYQDGQLAATASGNGLVRSYTYDPLTGLLDGSTTVDGSGAPVEDTTVLREAVSGIFSYLEITAETTTHVGVVATTSEHYALAPLLNDPGPWIEAGRRVWFWTADTGETRSFSYDALGNQTGLIAPSSFAYNAEGNRLLQADPHGQGVIDYSYDEAGFATSRAGIPLTWTASGRLSGYGSDTILEWDGLDRLLSTSFDGQTQRWRFGGRVLADGDGSPTALERDEVRIDLVGDTRRYRHFDFRGNVKFVTDEAGVVVSHVRYAPYGVDEVLGADDDPIRFVGRAELGDLAILGARIYDPAVGRFLSPDPILGVVNQYAYTLGNPVWFTDPDGLESTASGIEDGASGVAFAAGVVAAVAGGPVGAVALGIALGIGGLAFALMVARRLSRVAGVVGSGSFGCSPASLVSLPRPGWLLYAVILLQLLLSLLVLRQRRDDSR
ncbi:MAG: RHS repeat-associated core domain-containing protein, partial [Myxococcota bacterium]